MSNYFKFQKLKSSSVKLRFTKKDRYFKSPPYIYYGDKKLVDFVNWDYLNLSGNLNLKNRTLNDISNYKTSSNSPRAVCGTSHPLIILEENLSSFFSKESSLLFSSKNQLLLTLVTNLFNENDHIFIEADSSNPLIDAVYLSNARLYYFSSKRLDLLENQLKKITDNNKKALFFSSVSPITSELAPIIDLVQISTKFNVTTFLDESLSVASINIDGTGLAKLYKLEKEIFCIYGSLSQGFNSLGGYITGSEELIDYIYERSKTFNNETPFNDYIIFNNLNNLSYIQNSIELINKNFLMRKAFNKSLSELSYNVKDSSSNFICLKFNKQSTATLLKEKLFELGILSESLCCFENNFSSPKIIVPITNPEPSTLISINSKSHTLNTMNMQIDLNNLNPTHKSTITNMLLSQYSILRLIINSSLSEEIINKTLNAFHDLKNFVNTVDSN